jgi:hypothetical protein
MRAAKAVDEHLRADTAALAAYVGRIEHVYDCYLQSRDAFYESEGRWDSEFWRRRGARRSDHSQTRSSAVVGS